MEDVARLALIEECVRDVEIFRNILYELLRFINLILENPHEYQLRTIKSELLSEVSEFKSVSEYLKYIGFELVEDGLVYPKESTLSNLRMAQVAIERKINYCFGSIDKNQISTCDQNQLTFKHDLKIVKVLNTTNPFLLKIQDLFNNMLVYEDPDLQALAREQIPVVTLQLMALDRVREHQKQLKTGEIQGTDLPFDIAMLIELMHWFKEQFFSWVDRPACDLCRGETAFVETSTMTTADEVCRVELYKCTSCGAEVRFPRYNSVRTLLRTRRGRCGEWANAFTLLCRAMRYDARYIYDTTDHVWCEVFDYDTKTWLHVDPCEAKIDTPLMYAHGWGKKLNYVIALSHDDIQDVTWRYTTNHKEVLTRRRECSEAELLDAILKMRAARQSAFTEQRRLYLNRRTALELVTLMVEREAGESERGGRMSGASAWRRARGEAGHCPHTFTLAAPATYSIRYYSASDEYRIYVDEKLSEVIKGWSAGVYRHQHMFRKVEHDWRMVYLAREEGAAYGTVSWRVECGEGLVCSRLSLTAITAVYESGAIDWTVAFDGGEPETVVLGAGGWSSRRRFTACVVSARVRGGAGGAAWQHAQLFRHAATRHAPALHVTLHVQ